MTYEKPEIVDLGDMEDLTAATNTGPNEDGGNKHHEPSQTTAPSRA
jgi:hypothetical protein